MSRKHSKHNNKRKDKRPTGIPTGIQRLDRELMSEIKLFVSLGNTISHTAKVYHISEQMVRYSCKIGKDFDSLQNELLKEEE